MKADFAARLTARLHAELEAADGVEVGFITVLLTRPDATRLLRMLEFIAAARAETLRDD